MYGNEITINWIIGIYRNKPHTSAGTEFDFYSYRRLGILKNKISQ